jgi:glycine cleavage system aminomethyltransferase T
MTETNPPKEIELSNIHEALGAKMVPFAGFPHARAVFSGVNDEHLTVRKAVGVFDVSHMGEFLVRGPQAPGPHPKGHQQRCLQAHPRQGAIQLPAE